MNTNYRELINKTGSQRILTGEPLWKYSSFHIGGVADLFYKAQTVEELHNIIILARTLEIPFFVISGGTNLLISDNGFRGLVIKNDSKNIRLAGIRGGKNMNITKISTVYLEVDSGVGINRLVRYTLDQGFIGLEAFLGQPGCVGGAVWINAHNMSMGKYFGDSIYSAKLLDSKNEIKEVTHSYFKFSYDQSIIQKTKDIVLSVNLNLTTGDKEKSWKLAQDALEYRRKSQPSGKFTSGCTFRNISTSEAIRLATPNYTTSAGYLLDSLGMKGYRLGGAYLSTEHANFIINDGSAKAADVWKIIKLAKKKVKEKYNINLHEEIVLIGDFNE